jgi:VanZ family protein
MRRWAIFFGVFVLIVIALADTGHLGNLGLVYAFPGGPWVGHFFLFGLLGFVVNWSVFQARPAADRRRIALMTSALLAVFVALEEFSQRFLPTRHSDLLDFGFSSLGIATFALLAVHLKR